VKLKEWLIKEGSLQKDVADAIGVSRSLFSDLVKEKRRATPEMAKMIEEFTKGEVSRLEMMYPGEDIVQNRRGTPLTFEIRRQVLAKVALQGQGGANGQDEQGGIHPIE